MTEQQAAVGRAEAGGHPGFATARLPEIFAEVAQDGSRYDGLLGTAHGWLSDCSLPSGGVTRAVRHRAHDEIWFVRAGRGQVWRAAAGREEVLDAGVGTCLTIPAGTAFQFRTVGPQPFRFLILQAPPWPDESSEPALAHVDGPWTPDTRG